MPHPRAPLRFAALLAIAAHAFAETGAGTAPPEKMQTFIEGGGWCWFQDPRVIIAHNKLVVGAISIRPRAQVKAAVFDLDTGTHLGTAILNDDFQPDDHNAPVFHLRPDGALLAVYAKHGGDEKHYYRISEPLDFLKWTPERTFAHPGARVTYMNLYRMDSEDRLYCFYRRTESSPGGPSLNNPFFMTSDDHGNTWTEGRLLIEDGIDGVHRPYVRYAGDGKVVHLLFTEAHPRNHNTSIYYAVFTGGAFFRANGSRIKSLDEGPLHPHEADLVFQGGESRIAWCSSIEIDAAGRPHAAFSVRHTLEDHRFHHAYWDGGAWREREAAYAGAALYEKEQDYTGLITLDPEDPRVMYISTPVDPGTGAATGTGKHEIYTATLNPEASSALSWRALTADSPDPNLRPVCAAGGGRKVLLWLRGPWKTYTDYDTNVVGLILK